MNDNYPDDIHKYDDVPGSPFYDDRGEESRNEWIAETANDLLKSDGEMFEALNSLSDEDLLTIGKLIRGLTAENGNEMRIGKLIVVRVAEHMEDAAEREFDKQEPFKHDDCE